MNKIYNWLVFSSKNPQEAGMTIKALVPLLVLFNIGDPQINNQIADTAVSLLVKAGEVVSLGFTLWGFVRKLWRTV